MDLKFAIILLLFITVILLDYNHNKIEKLKETFLEQAPFAITKNCRLSENKQPYSYPQPSDKYMSVAKECISQQDFAAKNYYDVDDLINKDPRFFRTNSLDVDDLISNARMTGYPRQPRPLV